MNEAEFETRISTADVRSFAEISGDWNPLHTDPSYAANTAFRKPIAHGAFSAGLVSRMAGMHIPGRDCLLHNIRLKFVAPIFPPATVRVTGRLVREAGSGGTVEVVISDSTTGTLYVEGSYEFGRHVESVAQASQPVSRTEAEDGAILVTGASGSLGGAVAKLLGSQALPVSRSAIAAGISVEDFSRLPEILGARKLGGVVHCGWPGPDNQRLTLLGKDTAAAVQHHVAEPLADCIKLAQILQTHGLPGATLVLVGSTAAAPGRHGWQMPLYSLSKSLLTTLVQTLSVELGTADKRCIGVAFDVIDGGMNSGMRDAAKIAHADRSPFGKLPLPEDAAEQIKWVLENRSWLVSGAMMTLSGSALP